MTVFKGWENYVDRLLANWNKTVGKDDTVVIVGDVSWGIDFEQSYQDFYFIDKELNGKKIILKGNHDYWFSTKKKCDEFLEKNGFNSISFLFNNAFLYENYALCGTRGWINEPGESNDRKVLLREAGRLKLSFDEGKKLSDNIIAFLHYPPVYYLSECKEIMDILKEYEIKTCYYGHIHGGSSQYAIDGVYKEIDFHLVSADYIGFNPVKIL